MFAGRRYRIEFDAQQSAYALRTASTCRAVWNAALDQRRIAAALPCGRRPTYASQCRELADAKASEAWLAEAPAQSLQQTLRDLDRACRQHGPLGVHWRKRDLWKPSFNFPDRKTIGEVRKLNRRWGELRLPKFGKVRFRLTRPIAGTIRNATVRRDGLHWFIALCVDDGAAEATWNGLPPVGIDRGVAVAVATSDAELFSLHGVRRRDDIHLQRLQRRLSRQHKGSRRRGRTLHTIGRVLQRARNRRSDFCHQVAHRLTTEHGLIVLEDLRVPALTASAHGTVEQPGRCVAQKSGLNRLILDRAWGMLREMVEWHGRKNGCAVLTVPAAYTSQTCSACQHVSALSRESQADFCCVACGHKANADVNAARNILALGLRASGRGGSVQGPPLKRQPPNQDSVRGFWSGNPLPQVWGGGQSLARGVPLFSARPLV